MTSDPRIRSISRPTLRHEGPWDAGDERQFEGFVALGGDEPEPMPVVNEPIPITRNSGKKKRRRPPADLPPKTIILPPPANPMAVARRLINNHKHNGKLTLRHWRGGWWVWAGSHWVELEKDAVRADAYAFTEKAYFDEGGLLGQLEALTDSIPDIGDLQPWQPTRFKIGNLLEAMAAIVHLDETTDQPTWIGVEGLPVVAVANGLLRLDRRILLPHTPSYFNQTAVPFDFDPMAPEPTEWLRFLKQLWPDDPDSIAALQEFIGYVISGRLDQHKILLIVGPTRAGKGTIARIIGKLIGPRNVAGPTLSSLSNDFGMAPLIGRSLAVISDARLNVYRDSSIVVERLLAISGEDTITVNRKYKDQWTGKLPTRFLVISNELPGLGDASGTIANRFVVLQLRESWLDREDHGLEARLSSELTGILNWALDGLDRLNSQGHFTRPASTDEAILALQDLASPVAAFVRDCCRTGPTCEVRVDALYLAWRNWAETNGHRAGSVQTFGRNLRAVLPGLRASQPRDGGSRDRVYRGVGLVSTDTAHDGSDRVPSRADNREHQPGTHRHAVRPIAGLTRPASSLADTEGQPLNLTIPWDDPPGPLT